MDRIWVENYRCFREKQNVPLTRLTLLVGENSTGKTSFLAMIHALSSLRTWLFGNPDFKDPYDLGSFDEIAHFRGEKDGRAESFSGGCEHPCLDEEHEPYKFSLAFEKRAGAPAVSTVRSERNKIWVEMKYDSQTADDAMLPLTRSGVVGSPRGEWNWEWERDDAEWVLNFTPVKSDMPEVGDDERTGIAELSTAGARSPIGKELLTENVIIPQRIIAPSPVRAKPKRTYDPVSLTLDPEGSYIASLFAHLARYELEEWKSLKGKLEAFGKESGMFEEIDVVKPLEDSDAGPFQIRIRTANGRLESPWRNLADVGYGVSQLLPTATEMFTTSMPTLYLLQQPETHLHPSAQAALGTQMCRTAAEDGNQLVVETHSDYLMNRVRMDVRDQKTDLTHKDVTLLYFERDGMDVRIWPVRFDAHGEIIGAPDSYRRFFMRETHRSIGL